MANKKVVELHPQNVVMTPRSLLYKKLQLYQEKRSSLILKSKRTP